MRHTYYRCPVAAATVHIASIRCSRDSPNRARQPQSVIGPGRFDVHELFTALARHAVEFVTVGGIAIQAHAGQRLTRDLDIAIAPSTENITRLADALLDLDARILGPNGRQSQSVPSAPLLASSRQWQLITLHGPLGIITLPAQLGSFTDMRARAHEVPLRDLSIPIAHRDDLLKMKRTADRPQDLADVRLLESLDDTP